VAAVGSEYQFKDLSLFLGTEGSCWGGLKKRSGMSSYAEEGLDG
jgi:hypothetical protein